MKEEVISSFQGFLQLYELNLYHRSPDLIMYVYKVNSVHHNNFYQDSSVNIEIRLWPGWLGFNSWQGHRIFSLCHYIQISSGAHPASNPVVTSGRLKWLHQGVDHLSPSSAKVMNAWNCTSTSAYFFVAWFLIKHRMSSWHGV